ncbi:MAG: hypothetical protein AMXMBFR12_04710 [Candidatus Babeliales bacterium]
MIKKLLLCVLLFFVFSIYSQENENKKSWLSKVTRISLAGLKSGAKLYTSVWGATVISGYAHEYGHALTSQLLFKGQTKVTINHHWNPFLIDGFTEHQYSNAIYDNHKNAFVSLAGPIAGLAACYVMLKLSTFLSCYIEKRNKMRAVQLTEDPDSKLALFLKEGWSIGSAIRKTFSKESFINHHQSVEFQVGVVLTSINHMGSLFPYSSRVSHFPAPLASDGDRIAEALLGKSLYKESPDFWFKILSRSIVGWTSLGVGSVIFAHLCKKIRSETKVALALQEGNNRYAHLGLDTARQKLKELQNELFITHAKKQGKKILLEEHIAELENK